MSLFQFYFTVLAATSVLYFINSTIKDNDYIMKCDGDDLLLKIIGNFICAIGSGIFWPITVITLIITILFNLSQSILLLINEFNKPKIKPKNRKVGTVRDLDNNNFY